MDDDAVAPLLQARTRIDQMLEALRLKMTVLSKKREALTGAINVLQSGDEDLVDMPVFKSRNGKARVVNFDENAVESIILEQLSLTKRGISKSYIREALDGQHVSYSLAGLNRILKTSPSIKKSGQRDQTLYHLK